MQEETARPNDTDNGNAQTLQREFVAATDVQKDGATCARMSLAQRA